MKSQKLCTTCVQLYPIDEDHACPEGNAEYIEAMVDQAIEDACHSHALYRK